MDSTTSGGGIDSIGCGSLQSQHTERLQCNSLPVSPKPLNDRSMRYHWVQRIGICRRYHNDGRMGGWQLCRQDPPSNSLIAWARLEVLMRLNRIEAKKVKEVRQGESTHQKHPMVRFEPHDVT